MHESVMLEVLFHSSFFLLWTERNKCGMARGIPTTYYYLLDFFYTPMMTQEIKGHARTYTIIVITTRSVILATLLSDASKCWCGYVRCRLTYTNLVYDNNDSYK